ncbi:MAG: energy transducer TonB [Allosphingosinicella sp.]
MMEGAFYQPKRTNRTALAAVVLIHGAALTALALAKGEAIVEAFRPIKVYHVDEVKPPPEEPPPPAQRARIEPPPSVMTHVPPIVPPPPFERFVESTPPPPVQPPVIPQQREIVPPRIDPPARPEEPRTVEPARARANLASYVSDEDYPSNAVRNEEQGTTRFQLAVGPDGKVKECSVTRSSGSSALDATTCRLMKQRARFTPARNNKGELTSDTVASAIRWVLPTD